MRSQASLQQIIIYVLLILSAGIIGPMSYFDTYSPHQVANTYHVTIFEDPTDINQVAVALRQKGQQQRLEYALNRQAQQLSAISHTVSLPDFAKTLQLAATPYNLADVITFHANQQCLVCKLPDSLLAPGSADLPHPEKPPSRLTLPLAPK